MHRSAWRRLPASAAVSACFVDFCGDGEPSVVREDPVVFQVTSGAASSTLGPVIRLAEPPRLVWPTQEVRVSYLVGEQADCLLRGTPAQWLEAASEDFAGFVAARRGVQVRWSVPCTIFWYVSGEFYLGTLVIRRRLSPELAEAGGHVGYHVVAPWRRQRHATRMLAAGAAASSIASSRPGSCRASTPTHWSA